jgi:hypothetical protein
MEREKGFEPEISRGFSGPYAPPPIAPESPTLPPDASVHVPTGTLWHDTDEDPTVQPEVAPEISIEAGFTIALGATNAGPDEAALEATVRRAVQHAAALKRGNATVVTPSPLLP